MTLRGSLGDGFRRTAVFLETLVFAMQLVYRSIQMMLLNVPRDARRNEIVDRESARQPLANHRRRDVPRVRVNEVNPCRTLDIVVFPRGQRGARAQFRRTRRRVVDGRAGARNDHEMGKIEDARISVPRRNSCKRVGAENEEKLLRAPSAMMQRAQGVFGI